MSTLTRNTERLTTTIDAWTNLAPTKSFAGMTLEAFKLAVAPAITARERVDNLADQLPAARVDRANADKMAMPVIDRVVAAVLADGTEGPDGVLYAGLGYVRKSDRRSGLTRRTAAESETPPPAKAA
ncbi:MAG TPA: hypothetical protein VGD81_04660 [Opitutaceae bacterium]